MSDPIQQHFLGCSIRNFNINLGWANQATTVNVGLVEDDSLWERFSGFIGQLVRFQYDNWTFDGVLSNIKETKSESGNRLWEAVISDPRELLGGVQLIIGGYTGYTYNVPNLYNIYGYLESTGYGNSESNEAGISWRLIENTFTRLNQTTPVFLAGYPYYIDLSALPNVPEDYRISSTNISLLDYIQDICELANHDFTVILLGNYIKILTVSRNIQQLNGSIYRFLNKLPEFISMEAGFELQYNTANKFIVGGQVEQMYYQFNDGLGINNIRTPAYDDTITRYWGKDLLGNAKIAYRTYSSGISVGTPGLVDEVNEQFFLDGKPMSFPGNNWYDYPTDMDELRCAIESRESWETFLWQNSLTTKNSGSIHYGKADKLRFPPDVKVDSVADINVNISQLKPKDFAKLERNIYISSNSEQYIQKVYDYVSTFAREYLDKKFMVRIPFVFGKYQEDGNIKTSLEPTETGYIEESLLQRAVANNYLPEYNDFLLSPENKLYCYVRFGPFNIINLDLSELSEDDYYTNNNYLFVKATVEQDLVFLNRNTAFSPRAVVTLPGRVKYNDDSQGLSLLEIEYIKNKPDTTIPGKPLTEKEYAVRDFAIWKKQVGADAFYIDKSRYGLAPEMAAIPLKDNTTTYGPWYTQNMQGVVEFVQDNDLVPWNFGGFTQMNAAGQAMVRDVLLTTMIGEAGSVEVPGSPIYNIAEEIIGGGPLITQITTSIGENGVTTTYRFDKWNRDHGKETTHRVETFKRLHAIKRENQKKFIKLFKPSPPFKNISFGSIAASVASTKPRRIQSRTSHPIIMATTFEKKNGKQGYNIGSMPFYQVQNTLDVEDWTTVAGVSYDALYIPFTTDVNAVSGMPHFESPISGFPTVDELNPFKGGHSISVAVLGSDISGHTNISMEEEGVDSTYRGIALRGPIVISSWGYDTRERPVPNSYFSGVLPGSSGSGITVSGSKDAFNEDYLQDISLWKTGPMDIRWDDNRKVWVASGEPQKYVRDLRVENVSGISYYDYELVTFGSGEWKNYFMARNC